MCKLAGPERDLAEARHLHRRNGNQYLGIGELPQQEVADALLAAGADR